MPVAYKETGPIADPNLEAGRLNSFQSGKWPHPDDSRCSAANMAKAGFYYKGFKDQVKCFCCHIKLEGWTVEEDDPWQKHSCVCYFGKLGKPEEDLNVEQWIDVFCNQAINLLDLKLNKLNENL